MHRPESEVWLMPIGELLDQWELYKQWHGLSKPKVEHYIDDVIPSGI